MVTTHKTTCPAKRPVHTCRCVCAIHGRSKLSIALQALERGDTAPWLPCLAVSRPREPPLGSAQPAHHET
eukprot:1515917-Prymnesium_polylepis.1